MTESTTISVQRTLPQHDSSHSLAKLSPVLPPGISVNILTSQSVLPPSNDAGGGLHNDFTSTLMSGQTTANDSQLNNAGEGIYVILMFIIYSFCHFIFYIHFHLAGKKTSTTSTALKKYDKTCTNTFVQGCQLVIYISS